jgi:hypothetical protein
MLFRANAYVLDDGGDVVSSWYAEHERWPKITVRLDLLMTHLLQQPRDNWIRPHYDTLRDGVGEIRFKVNRIQHRPIGFFGPERNDFTFLLFATKSAEFYPRNAIDVAVALKTRVENGTARTVRIVRWDQ